MCRRCDEKKRKKRRKPRGAYTIDLGGFPGNFCFHQGGTVHGATGVDINFPSPLSPTGVFGLTWTGDFKKKREDRKYQIIMTNVLSTKSDIGPAVPLARAKFTLDIKFDKCFKKFSGIFFVAFYQLDDLTLTKLLQVPPPLELPIKGLKVVA